MSNDQIDHGIKTVETMAEGLTKDFQIFKNNNNETLSRLVWFVAIAGFALLNMNKLAADIIGTSITGIQLVILVLPWVLVALSGVIAHYLLGEVSASDSEFYILKQHSLRAWIANAKPRPTMKEVLEILNIDETDNDLITIKKKTVELLKQASTWEKTTLFGLIFAFSWSILFPLLIS